ncbi:DUF5723 family protein [Daejeonella lutea]|uniref:Outer membrane insertion C-terminal signal n=1 Tax=Daejeonella lutea TaxID=572036 RepID=A0A1T5B8N4_9SPHI|nr:DUF5723 family protein [Daejeonella lutea]SKB43409.1 outer membrane insertion C-terminal signal [Daejeonella lutea]
MKKIFWLLIFLISAGQAAGQQFNLYNSRTLYDVFENPSQSAYQIDTSRRMAFNFFIPTITINASASGSASPAFRPLIYDGVINADNIPIGENKFNTVAFNTNTYIIMLRWLHTVKKSQEIGLSWQVRDDGRIKATNETLAIFDDYDLFNNTTSAKGFFNNKGYNQSYHQLSLSYRQDLTKRFSIGAKGSLLSGITHTAFKVTESDVAIDQEEDIIGVSVIGNLRSSFKFDNFDSQAIKPKFKNPGLSFTAGASYKFRNGWFLMGNLKDLGFIKWNKESYEYNFDASNIVILNASNSSADNRLADSLDKRISNSSTNRSYFSLLNGKAEVLLNKNYGNYQPNLILSKSVYYEGADIVLTNNYHYRNFVFTASADYNTSKYLAVGGQFMVKSPNAEFFLGSDQLFKTLQLIKESRKDTGPYSSGYAGMSFYMGFGMKFGRVLEHPANANFIPGFNEPWATRFFKGIFKKKEK